MLLVGCFIAVGLAATLRAADTPKMFATRIDIPERGEVPGYLFVVGTNKFSFIAPQGWKPEGKVERREVVFMAPDLDASLTLKILGSTNSMTAKEVRESLEQRFPNARLLNEFNCHGATQSGWGFDLEQVAAEKARVRIRLGVVPLPDGVAEVVLRAPAARIGDLYFVFGRFLASFQVEGHRPRS